MHKNVMYILSLAAVACTAFAMGSVAINPVGPGGATPESSHQTFATLPYYSFVATPSAGANEILFRVPAGRVFAVDDVIIVNSLGSNVQVCLKRGVVNLNNAMCARIPAFGTFDHSFTGLRLSANENLTVFAPTYGTTWTVTGHLV